MRGRYSPFALKTITGGEPMSPSSSNHLLRSRAFRIATIVTLAAIIPLALTLVLAQAYPANASGGGGGIVMSQVYGGGGATSGAPAYRNDYVELFNAGSATVDISGWTIQYGSATGNFASVTTNIYTFSTGITIQPGKYLLVQLSGGSVGPVISPTADISTTNLTVSAASGKVALANIGSPLGCGATATPCTLPDSRIVDLVSFGASNNAEGNAPVNNGVPLDSTKGAVRKLGGCQDTDNNNNDFTVVVSPTLVPRNSQSPTNLCGLRLSKSAPAQTAVNNVYTYTITVINATVTATNVVITDLVPANATFVPNSASDGGDLMNGTIVTWTVASLAHAATITRTFMVTAPAVPATITNQDYQVYSTEIPTPTLGAAVNTQVRASDLTASKTGPAVVMPGEQLTYTISVPNIGMAGTSNLVVTDTLPSNTTYVSDTTGVTPASQGNIYAWTLPGVAAGGTYSFSLVVSASPAIPFGSVLTNTVDVATSDAEESTTNNHGQWAVTVGGPDLVVVKQAPATASPGDVIPFTLTVANAGAVPATGVWLTDTLPAQVSYAGDSRGGFTAQNGQAYGWSLGALTPGTGITFTVSVTVSPSAHANDLLTNVARVIETETDQDVSNNVFTTTTGILGADPYIVKTGPAAMFGGEIVSYTLVYGNGGNQPADVTMTDTLPAGFGVGDIAGDTSGLTPVDGTNTRTWTATVAAGDRLTFTLALTVPASIVNNTRVTNTVNLVTAAAGNDTANDQSQAGGNVYQLVPIATARAGSNGQVFALEGRVTVVPLTFGTNEWEFQDNSGGISAFYSPPPPVALGDRVRLVATRGAFNNQEQMASPVYYSARLGSGPLVDPLPYTTGAVASGSSEGWLVVVTGTISGLGACTGNYQFNVDDGSGAAVIFVDADTAINVCTMGWSNGDYVRVIGFSTQYQTMFEIKPRMVSDMWRRTTGLQISKAVPSTIVYSNVFTYALTARNDSDGTLTNIVITDRLPISVSIGAISDGGELLPGGVVSWTVGSLAQTASAVRTVAVTAPNYFAVLVNSDYGVSATEYVTRVVGAPVTTRVVQNYCTICRVQGGGGSSPFVGQVVSVTGVIYDLIYTNGPSSTRYGFFMQAKDGAGDGDSGTSDGIYVYLNAVKTIGAYTPTVGDEVIITGTVAETNGLTQIVNPSGATVINSYASLVGIVSSTPLVPFDDTTADGTYRETLESMRVIVPAGAPVVAPTYFFVSTSDTEIYVIRGDHPVAQRADPFARRVWRDGEALDWGTSTDGNSYRISVEANVLKAKANDYNVQMPRANVYDVVTNPLVGPLIYAFSRYTLMIEDTPVISATVDAFTNNPPQPPDRLRQYSIATMNLENLYDNLDDPFDSCDFNGGSNTGCSGNGSTSNPPYDYPAASLAAYQSHLGKLAMGVLNGAQSPDILTVEEAEDQDVCAGGGQIYGACGSTNNADGKPDVLQDLAQEIYIRSGNTISYQVTLDRQGKDYRGIVTGFMYRADRVELVPTSALSADPVLGLRPTDPYSATYPHNTLVLNPKALQAPSSGAVLAEGGGPDLFDRPPEVALFRVHRTSVSDNDYVDVYALGNHFKSGPDTSVVRRTAQASYNAQLVNDILAVRPNVRVAVLGDLNVYPDSAQLAGLNAVMSNLHYQIPAASRYSYMYQGQTQTLDQIFVNGTLSQTLVAARAAHVNADWSYDWQPISTTIHQSSDHDPIVGTFNLPLLPANLNASFKTTSVTGQVMPGSLVTYTIVLSNSGVVNATATITDVLGSYYSVYNAMGFSQPTTGTLTWTGVVTGGKSVTLNFVAQVVSLSKLVIGSTTLNNSVTVNDGINTPFVINAPNPPWVRIYGVYMPIVTR
jgi:uncharacterized repeat protein (TIGR01451 family)